MIQITHCRAPAPQPTPRTVQYRAFLVNYSLQRFQSFPEFPRPSIATVASIQRVVANYFNIPFDEMRSARRSRDVARPRQVAMYLSKRLTRRSLPEIGRRFGDRDHTTVIHAIKQIERLCGEDTEFAADVLACAKRVAA